MNTKDLAKKLKESNITPVKYTPSEAFKKATHICIFANGYPMLLTGFANLNNKEDMLKSWEEAEKLLKSEDFRKICAIELGFSTFSTDETGIINFEKNLLDGNSEKMKYYGHKLYGIAKKERGEVITDEGETDLLYWVIVKGKLEFATAMCVSDEIQKIITK